MAHTIKSTKGLEKMFQQDFVAPSIAELSLMTPKEQKKRIEKYKRDLIKINSTYFPVK